MAPRRRSEQLNSRQAQDELPIKRFYKLILDANIEAKMLRLPLKFVRKYRNKLSNIAKLKVSDGRVWEMELERAGENIWLHNGFDEFARHYSLSHGYQLYFKYKGTSNFKVCIYNLSCCEISYPPRTAIRISDSLIRPSSSTNKKNSPDKHKEPCEYQNASGILSPRHFKSRKPHFRIDLTDFNFTYRVAYVPTEFYTKHITGPIGKRESVELELYDGKKWNVALKRKRCGRMILGGGWKDFLDENRLKERDVCLFELVKKNAFNVHLFIAL